MNTLMSILKLVYVGTTYNSVGRSGEAAYSCFDNGSYWDSDDEKFYFSQKEMKVGDEKKKNRIRVRVLLTRSILAVLYLLSDLRRITVYWT